MGGGSRLEESANRLGLPIDLVKEADGFSGAEDGIFPDNFVIVKVFMGMMRQWRIGMNGVVGMDYAALPSIPAVRRITDEDEYDDMFECLQVMEIAALAEIRGK